ncbi:hypothetical protein OHW08_10055 [Acinetobacter baumannii]|nr:hypothetical protein [Acinetobacter baumannii]MDC4929864.1 hypothetical protein [Acinetobacter baumannii]MDC4968731.1 hypothetical protein [Acinetobacter baumannii]
MLFSEEEIKRLELFKRIAIKFNRCLLNVQQDPENYIDGVAQTIYGPITIDLFFKNLKNLFIELDLIFKSKLISSVNEDIYNDLYKIINDLDSNIIRNLDSTYLGKSKNKFSIERLFMDLYTFINEVFRKGSRYTTAFDFSHLSDDTTGFYRSFIKLVKTRTFDDNEKYKELIFKINNFEERIKEFSKSSDNNASEFRKELDNFFSNQRIAFEQRVNETINIFNSDINNIENKYKTDLVSQINDLNNQVTSSKNEVDNLDQAIESYKSTVSTKIQNEISKHYQKKAKMEMITYWGATSFSIFLILSSLGLLAWGLVDYYHDYISTNVCLKDEAFNACVSRLEKVRDITKNIGITFFVMRFSFSLLLFLTVIYTSRIAIRAYSHWRHSENMHLKLSSLEPFITELPKEVRHEIHRELIPDYFGKDAGLIDTANEKFKDLPANISAVAMKAIEQISGSGSNSSTERNGKKPENETG